MVYKYKRYSTLWFLSVYGVISSILNIIYYFRFKHIYTKQQKEKEIKQIKQKKKQKEIIKKEEKEENVEKIEELNIIKKSPNPQKNVGSSLGKLLDTKDVIKEANSDEEKTYQDNKHNINDFSSNVTNINNINNQISMMPPLDEENDEDIIYNPYREDFIPDSSASKKSKEIKNKNNIPELKLKEINNKANSEETNILKSYRSSGSEENNLSYMNSQNSQNPINNLSGFNSKLFSDKNNKKNEEKIDDDDDEDNSSVIHNPLRDDI